METGRVVKIGYHVDKNVLSSKEKLLALLSEKRFFKVRRLFALRDYLVQYSKIFDDVIFRFTDTGITEKTNRSEVDIGFNGQIMNDERKKIVDFSYPYKLDSVTFIIQKPEYKPQVFGIFQTFSLSLWVAIILVLVAISLIFYIVLKSRYPLDKILLHVLAVFLRQSSILRHSSSAENFLFYSWVLGAMFICLAYDSVFLSFMAFPPVIPIKDTSDLATAVKNGEYRCFDSAGFYKLLIQSKQENLKVIAKDSLNSNIRFDDIYWDFLFDRKKLNIAFLIHEGNVPYMNIGEKFVSEERFIETMASMMVRKGFCCKELLETFVHRQMSSGLYIKDKSDSTFFYRLPLLLKSQKKYNNKRKITLTDVAPAFIFLLAGYFVSFLALIGETVSNRRIKMKCLEHGCIIEEG